MFLTHYELPKSAYTLIRSRLHYFEMLKNVQYEDYEMTYKTENRFQFMVGQQGVNPFRRGPIARVANVLLQ